MNPFFRHIYYYSQGGGETPTLFVSSSGSSGDGTEANPWSPAEFLTALATIESGERIGFKRGDTFEIGEIDVTVANLTFLAYGEGDKPIISGSTNIGGNTWVDDGGDIFYTTLSTPPKHLYIDGVAQTLAETDFIPITARTATNKLTALQATLDALNATESLIGAYCVAKEYAFRPTFKVTVTAYSAGVLTFDEDIGALAGPGVNMPFKLLNKKSFITDVGEWSYDSSTQRLYVKTSGASPEGTDIRVGAYDYGFDISDGVANITIKNLDFTHQELEAIYSLSNNNIDINNCDFHDIRLNCVSLRGDSTNINIQNNTFARCQGNALHIGGVQGGVIKYNTFTDIGTQSGISIPYYTDYFRSVGCGIHIRWDVLAAISTAGDLDVSYNNFENMGYVGIAFCGRNNLFEYNLVDTFLVTWNDGGGIYCAHRSIGTSPATEDCIVRKNIVLNSVGNLDGIAGSPEILAVGLYIDNNSTRITLDDNVVESCTYGIINNFLCPANTITNNLLVDNTTGVYISEYPSYDSAPPFDTLYPETETIILTGNTIACRLATQRCIVLKSWDLNDAFNPFSVGGQSDNNKFIQLYDTEVAQFIGTTTTDYEIAGWRTLLSQDALSTTPRLDSLFFLGTDIVDDEVLLTTNTTYVSVADVAPDGYLDSSGVVVTDQTIPAFGAVLNIKEDNRDVYDTFTGSAGNITAHTPDIGPAWTLQSGTIALNGSGEITASVAGEITQDAGYKNIMIDTRAKISANGVISIMLRWSDIANRIIIQLQFDTTDRINVINTVAGVSTTISTLVVTTSLNTYYRLRVRIIDNRILVWLDDVIKIDVTDAAFASNGSSTVHGLRMNTLATHDDVIIYKTTYP